MQPTLYTPEQLREIITNASAAAREIPMPRPALVAILNGRTDPRASTLAVISEYARKLANTGGAEQGND